MAEAVKMLSLVCVEGNARRIRAVFVLLIVAEAVVKRKLRLFLKNCTVLIINGNLAVFFKLKLNISGLNKNAVTALFKFTFRRLRHKGKVFFKNLSARERFKAHGVFSACRNAYGFAVTVKH